MTLNQVIDRLKGIILAHKQLRKFHYGLVTDYLTDRTSKYAVCVVQDNGGNIDLTSNTRMLLFRLYFLDLVNVSFRAKENEQDVISDMLSVAEDIIAQINYNGWTDWKLSASNPVSMLYEESTDFVAGVSLDITITTFFESNACDVPSDNVIIPPSDMDKDVYDLKYVATGTEGNALTLAQLANKKILFVTREFGPLYRVNASPDTSEYTFDGTVMGLGSNLGPRERLLVVFRNY